MLSSGSQAVHDPKNLELGRVAMQRGLLTRDQASQALNLATERRISLTASAIELRLLSAADAQSIEHSLDIRPESPPQVAAAARVPAHLQTRPDEESGVQSAVTKTRPPAASAEFASQSSSQVLPTPGDKIGEYEIVRLLGRGGMGAVYVARRGSLEYALKVILSTGDDAEALKRFEVEAQAAAQVDRHPNIVRIYNYDRLAEMPYLVLDLVDGVGLDELIIAGQAWAPEDALPIIIKMASALDLIHSKGILHRDLKPANILIRNDDGEPMLTDFGLAKDTNRETMTNTGEMLGTPAYMSPEQLMGDKENFGPATDVWALGVILNELVTGGERPFTGASMVEIANNVMLTNPTPARKHVPGLPQEIDFIIGRAIQKKASQRYASAGAMAADCARFLSGESIDAKGTSALARAVISIESSYGKGGLIAVILGLMVLGAMIPISAGLFVARERVIKDWRQEARLRLDAVYSELDRAKPKVTSALTEVFLSQAYDEAEARKVDTTELAAMAPLFEALRELKKCFDDADDRLWLGGQQNAVLDAKAFFRLQAEVGFYETVAALASGGAKPKARLSKQQNLLCESLSALLSEDLARAEIELSKLSKSLGDYSRFGSLGLGVVALRTGRVRDAIGRLRAFQTTREVRERIFRLMDDRVGARTLSVLVRDKPNLNSIEKAIGIQNELYKSESRQFDEPKRVAANWQRFGQRLNAVFSSEEREGPPNEQLLAAYYAIEKMRRRYPFLPLPVARSRIYIMLGKEAWKDRNLDLVARYFVRLKRYHPDFEPPTNMSFSDLIESARKLIARNLEKGLTMLFRIAREVREAGMYLPIVRPDLVRIYAGFGGVASEFKLDPKGSWPRYVRGMIVPLPEDYSSPQQLDLLLKKVIQDLDFVLEKKDLPESYLAMAMTSRVNAELDRVVYLERRPETRRQLVKSRQTDWLKSLDDAASLFHPEPDTIHLLRFRIYSVTAIPDVYMPHLDQALDWVKKRWDFTQNDKLAIGRPWHSPLSFMDYAGYQGLISAIQTLRAREFVRTGNDAEAEMIALEVISSAVQTNDSLLKLLVNLYLRQGKAKKAAGLKPKFTDPSQPSVRALFEKIDEALGN